MMCAHHMHIMRMAWPYGWSSVSMFSEWDAVETFILRASLHRGSRGRGAILL